MHGKVVMMTMTSTRELKQCRKDIQNATFFYVDLKSKHGILGNNLLSQIFDTVKITRM